PKFSQTPRARGLLSLPEEAGLKLAGEISSSHGEPKLKPIYAKTGTKASSRGTSIPRAFTSPR
ncbi:hypothetical protein KKF38_02180, partial [Patescibacteria group bacterium]|nr:hypothetical protein [Patescibacteria group bacterium]